MTIKTDAPVTVDEVPSAEPGIIRHRATVPVDPAHFFGQELVDVQASYDPGSGRLVCNLHGSIYITVAELERGEAALRRAIDCGVEGVVEDFFRHQDPWQRGLTAIALHTIANTKD